MQGYLLNVGSTKYNIDFPFSFDKFGHTASTSYENHVRDLIEQLLFTTPGERVNRPDFGSGVLSLIFSANSPELAAALQALITAAVQRWLSDLIDINTLEVTSEDSSLYITMQYRLQSTGEEQKATFRTTVP